MGLDVEYRADARRDEKSGFELGTAYLPTPDAANTGVVVGGGSLWVPKENSDAKKKEIGNFLAWLTNPKQQAFWHKNSGYFPVSQSSIDRLKKQNWFEKHPDFKTAFDQLKDTKTTPATAGALMGVFPKARSVNEKVSVSIITGKVSIEEGLNEMERKVNAALKNYKGNYSAGSK